MGIDFHSFNFLRYASRRKSLDRTVTIGRQRVFVTERNIRNAFESVNEDYKRRPYCEELLKRHLGASIVDSIDNSDYEHATIMHDMNRPLPRSLHGSYDSVFDGGCIEHIYNASRALKNCSLLCRPTGQIIHMLPSNNLCGHGFWQFSPELFFSLYCESNGYADTEVFLADLTNTKTWFKVTPPRDGNRVNVHSSTELYVLVRTVLKGNSFSHNDVQQSDYIFHWNKNESSGLPSDAQNAQAANLRSLAEESDILHRLLAPSYHLYRKIRVMVTVPFAVSRHPWLHEVEIAALVAGREALATQVEAVT